MPLSNPSTKHTDSELDIETLPEFTDYNNDLISIGNRDEFTFVVRYLGGRVVLKMTIYIGWENWLGLI